jgi:hypothetical protein
MKYLKYKYGEDLKAFLCNRGVKRVDGKTGNGGPGR